MADVALIGVGLVGSALAERFRLGGLSIVAFDLKTPPTEGISFADSARSAAEQAEWIVLSLPDSEVVQEVLDEIESVCVGKTIIDTTTGDPDRTMAIALRLKNIGIRYVDATITGSSRQVRDGTSIVTAGGESEIVRECSRFFELFARRWFYVGSSGAGSRIKLAINLVLGLNRAVLAEGLAFAKSMGLDLNATLDVLRESPAFSRVMDTKGARMISGDFEPEARLRQHWKDVRLIQHQAKQNGQAVPLSDLHSELLAKLDSRGLGDLDNSVIIRAFEGV